jgi:hypothetical protein
MGKGCSIANLVKTFGRDSIMPKKNLSIRSTLPDLGSYLTALVRGNFEGVELAWILIYGLRCHSAQSWIRRIRSGCSVCDGIYIFEILCAFNESSVSLGEMFVLRIFYFRRALRGF